MSLELSGFGVLGFCFGIQSDAIANRLYCIKWKRDSKAKNVNFNTGWVFKYVPRYIKISVAITYIYMCELGTCLVGFVIYYYIFLSRIPPLQTSTFHFTN